jgi:hypothetical protein
MNKLNANILAAVIVVCVFFFLGRLMFLANQQREIDAARDQLQSGTSQLAEFEAELERLKKAVKAENSISRGSNKLLQTGEEPSILRFILDNSGSSFKLNSYELLESYRIKPELENEAAAGSQFSTSEELPQLDDQGMPVGMSDDSDEEWPGVEIIPVKMTFMTTYLTLGGFLSEANKKLPMNAVRSMDLLLKRTVRGTLVMAFPVAEPQKK